MYKRASGKGSIVEAVVSRTGGISEWWYSIDGSSSGRVLRVSNVFLSEPVSLLSRWSVEVLILMWKMEVTMTLRFRIFAQ